MESKKAKILELLSNDLLPEFTRISLKNKLIELEIIEKVGKPGYDTLTSYYGKGEGLHYIKRYVSSLVEKEGFQIGSAIAQFDSNF